MDSLDAECLLIQLAEGEVPAPDLWRHDRSGALSCNYERSERTFSWRADDVARMALRWRNSDPSRLPEQAWAFVEAHERLIAVADEAGLGPADAITHHLGRREIRGRWDDKRVLVVVENIGNKAL